MSFDTFAQNSQYQFNQANKIGEEIADNEFKMMENQQKQQQQQFSNQLAQNAEDRNQWRFKQEQAKRQEELAQERFNRRDPNSTSELVRRIRAGEVDALTDDQREALLKSNILKNKITVNGWVDDSDAAIFAGIRGMTEQDLKNSGMNMDYFRRFNAERAKDPNIRYRQYLERIQFEKQIKDIKDYESLRAENLDLTKMRNELERKRLKNDMWTEDDEAKLAWTNSQIKANIAEMNRLRSQNDLNAERNSGQVIANTNAQKTVAQNKAAIAQANLAHQQNVDKLAEWNKHLSQIESLQNSLELEKTKTARDIFNLFGRETDYINARQKNLDAMFNAGASENKLKNKQIYYDTDNNNAKAKYNESSFTLKQQPTDFNAREIENQNRVKNATLKSLLTDIDILLAENANEKENLELKKEAQNAEIFTQNQNKKREAAEAEVNRNNYINQGQYTSKNDAQAKLLKSETNLSAAQQANKDQSIVNETESFKKRNALLEQQKQQNILANSLENTKMSQKDQELTRPILDDFLSGRLKYEDAKAAIEKSGITDKAKALKALMNAATTLSSSNNYSKVQEMAQNTIDDQYKNHQDAQSDKPILQNLMNDVYDGKYTPDDALEAINNNPNIKNKNAARSVVKAVLVDSKEWRQLQEQRTLMDYYTRKYTPQQELMLKVAAGLVSVDQLSVEDRRLLTGIERGIPDYKSLVNMQTNLRNDPGSYNIRPDFVQIAKGNTFLNLGSSSGNTKNGGNTNSKTSTPQTPSQNTSSEKKTPDDFYDIRNYAAKTYNTDIKKITKEDAAAIKKEYDRRDTKTGMRVYSKDGKGLNDAIDNVLGGRFSKYGTPPDGISPAQHNWATDLYGRYYANADDAMKKKIATMQEIYLKREAVAAKAKEENDISKKIQILENLDNEWELAFKKQLGDTDAAIPPSPWKLELIGFEYERAKRNRENLETSTDTAGWINWLKTDMPLSKFAETGFGLKNVPDKINEDEWNNERKKFVTTPHGSMLVKIRPLKETLMEQAQKIDARNPDAGAVFFVENILPKIIKRQRYIADQTDLEKRAAAIENATSK
jgi:hypothetical protein